MKWWTKQISSFLYTTREELWKCLQCPKCALSTLTTFINFLTTTQDKQHSYNSFFFIANDGVFEFLSSQAVIDMVSFKVYKFFLNDFKFEKLSCLSRENKAFSLLKWKIWVLKCSVSNLKYGKSRQCNTTGRH